MLDVAVVNVVFEIKGFVVAVVVEGVFVVVIVVEGVVKIFDVLVITCTIDV